MSKFKFSQLFNAAMVLWFGDLITDAECRRILKSISGESNDKECDDDA